MVPDLCGVVVDGAGGGQDEVFEGESVVGSVGDQAVEVVNVGLEVLSIMVLDGFLAHERFERVHGVGERG